jgi:hypothetical protein
MKLLPFVIAVWFFSAAHAGIEVKSKNPKVYIISIGFSGNDWKPDSTLKQIGYNYCPTCASDPNVFVDYFLKIGKLKKRNVDSVFSYSFSNGLQLDSLYAIFNQIQKKITSKDVFIFYYASGAWILNTNSITNKEESYYVLNNGLATKKDIAKHGFSLHTLKQLTDRLPANNQLLIFDTGLGSVIQNDFHSNFFNANPIEASFTKKNRIIICPDNFSSESRDEKDGVKKGDIVRTLTSMPDSLNILYIFDSSKASRNNNSNYKLMMQHFWAMQTCCFGTLKIMKESEYLQVLTAIQPNLSSGKRSTWINPQQQKVDSSFATRKKKAIIIATDSYNASNLWTNLSTPVKDGREVAVLLKSKFGYDTIVMVNASKQQIQKMIDEIVYKEVANPYNQYIIYFAGHGLWNPQRKIGYIVTSNSAGFTDPSSPESAELDSYLEYEQLFNNLKQLNKVILITDVCFGGTAFNSIVQNNAVVNPESEKTKPVNPYKKIFASGITEVDDFIRLHDGSISENSPFALSLIEVLKQAKSSVSFERLFADIKDKGLKPTPVSKDFGSITEPNEFVF